MIADRRITVRDGAVTLDDSAIAAIVRDELRRLVQEAAPRVTVTRVTRAPHPFDALAAQVSGEGSVAVWLAWHRYLWEASGNVGHAIRAVATAQRHGAAVPQWAQSAANAYLAEHARGAADAQRGSRGRCSPLQQAAQDDRDQHIAYLVEKLGQLGAPASLEARYAEVAEEVGLSAERVRAIYQRIAATGSSASRPTTRTIAARRPRRSS